MALLLDNGVWIHHFENNDGQVTRLLEEQLVVDHEFVIVELACGCFISRQETVRYLEAMPALPTIYTEELMSFIEARKLNYRGIGLVDFQLLGSTIVCGQTTFCTRDTGLNKMSRELGVRYIATSH